MSDDELAAYLGIAGHPKCGKVIAALTPAKRALYERMHQVEIEAQLWLAGLGPKPTGVLIDTVRSKRRKRMWAGALREGGNG
jgi:hypothetical protein